MGTLGGNFVTLQKFPKKIHSCTQIKYLFPSFRARFQENRTIFNTPNPRLMNVSLLKGSKTLLRGGSGPGGQRSRRGSQASVNSGGDAPPDSAPPPPPQAAGNKRPRPHRQPSTDTAASSGGAGGESSRPPTASGTNKRSTPRQESVNSNSNV